MTLPLLHMVGNAHLDPAWMWSWGEGMEAFLATCRSALDRMEENDAFIFTCSSAAHYRWVEQVEPELFERIRRKVESGRWALVGGWWVQADCNLPSGEGFVRQALLGQHYFLEKFGRVARTGYSPDAFGHNLGLPRLLSGAGLTRYIFCRPDPTELSLPSPLFRWIGPGGPAVLGYRVPFHYNMYESSVPKKVGDLTEAFAQPSDPALADRPLGEYGSEWMLFYGVGNHGGGPTREHLRQIMEIDADTTAPDLRFSAPDAFFDRVEQEGGAFTIPEWRDDLQMNAPGCYSAHAGIKHLNRRTEARLAVAEKLAVLAGLLCGTPYPAEELQGAWRDVCFNHFHDILCGVAIREALDDAVDTYGHASAVAAEVTRHAQARIARLVDTTGEGRVLLIFNPHSFAVQQHVTFEFWHDIDKALWNRPVHLRVTDEEGGQVPCQTTFTSGKIGRDRVGGVIPTAIPPLGWRCYRVHYGEASRVRPENGVAASDLVLENRFLRVEFSPESGAIARLFDRERGGDLLNGEGALPVVIDDPTDTWGHGVKTFDRRLGAFGNAEVRLVEQGPLLAVVRARSRWGSSWLQQDYRLYHDARDLEVEMKVFWGEERKMLKLLFPVAVADPETSAESAYCVTRKPCDGTERPCGTWAAVTGTAGEEAAGLGIASDTWHGYSAERTAEGTGALLMSLLRSAPCALHDPHPANDCEDLDFLDQGVRRFRYRILPFRGGNPGAALSAAAALMNQPLLPWFESGHEGEKTLQRFQGIRVEPSSISATVLKQSEEGDGWILRLFESSGCDTEARIEFPLLDLSWSVQMGPYDVRTFRMRRGEVLETDLIERPAEPR